MTITAQNVMAATPFGQALTTQNAEIVPDREEYARGVDERRHPVGDVQSRTPPDAGNVSRVDHARQAIESARHAEHAGGRVIRQQPLHRRLSVKAGQGPHGRAARVAQRRRFVRRTRCVW